MAKNQTILLRAFWEMIKMRPSVPSQQGSLQLQSPKAQTLSFIEFQITLKILLVSIIIIAVFRF